MLTRFGMLPAFAMALIASSYAGNSIAQAGKASDTLQGAWKGKVQFTTGAFADTKDLEFMYSFNAGGTMTESSNYDAAPPVPPAYGVWKKVGPRKFEARYQFYQSKAVTTSEELVKGGGWAPDGHGTLSQQITLSADGKAFESRITLELFDKDGKPIAGGGVATASGKRLGF